MQNITVWVFWGRKPGGDPRRRENSGLGWGYENFDLGHSTFGHCESIWLRNFRPTTLTCMILNNISGDSCGISRDCLPVLQDCHRLQPLHILLHVQGVQDGHEENISKVDIVKIPTQPQLNGRHKWTAPYSYPSKGGNLSTLAAHEKKFSHILCRHEWKLMKGLND